jgi:hypothetical protein
MTQARSQRRAVLLRVLRAHLVDLEIIAAVMLGRIHRLVGVLEQGFRIPASSGKKLRPIEAVTCSSVPSSRIQRRFHHLHDLFGNPRHIVVLHDMPQHHGELVAGITRHRIGSADAAAQTLRDDTQNLIAGGVAVACR